MYYTYLFEFWNNKATWLIILSKIIVNIKLIIFSFLASHINSFIKIIAKQFFKDLQKTVYTNNAFNHWNL